MAEYISRYTGQEIDERLALVTQLQAALTQVETTLASKYSKPTSGIPETDMDTEVQAALSLARTAVQSLSDYYTKEQIDDITAAIAASVDNTSGVVVTALPTASSSTLGKIYYVGPDASGFYDRYVTSYDGSSYAWIALGNTEVDMTQYATVEQLNALDQKVGDTETIHGEEAISIGTMVNGSVRYSTGASASSTTNKRTSFINIDGLGGKTLIYSRQRTTSSSPLQGLAFYSADNTDSYISGDAWIGDAAEDELERREIIVPATAKYVRFCTIGTFASDAYMRYVTETEVYVSGLGKEVDDLKEEVAEMEAAGKKEVADNLPAVVGIVWSGTVGSAPTQVEDGRYNSIAVTGLVAGDKVVAHSFPGSSYYNWLKVKDGIVTAVGALAVQFNDTVTCDGTFDTLLLNSYNTRLNPTTAALLREMGPFDYTDYMIEHSGDADIDYFRVLCFGNSFTQGSMGYVPAILHELAPDFHFRIVMAIIGGSPLAQHYAYFTGNEVTLGGYTYRIDPETGNYQRINSHGEVTFNSGYFVLRSIDGSAWAQTASGAHLENILDGETKWDIVTFQQNGNNADDDYDTYFAPFIYGLQDNLISRLATPAKLAWILTHGAYKSTSAERLTAWQNTALNAQKVMQRSAAGILFPYGTAVQNLRTIPALDALGDYGGGMQEDEGHLQQGIADLASAFAMAIVILKEAGIDVGIYGTEFLPYASVISSLGINWNVGTGPIGVSAANSRLAQIAAVKAVMNPYEVTDLTVFQSNQ